MFILANAWEFSVRTKKTETGIAQILPIFSIDASTEEALEDKSVSILHAKLLHLACAASLTVP